VRREPERPVGSARTRREEQFVSEVVLKAVQDGVATITLNRPERLNAWTEELERAYFDALADCGASSEVRVIVVTGAGRGFCAGADMDELKSLGEDGVDSTQAERERTAQTYPLSVPKPIIAAINGPCAGIGLVQALMCDIRFAAEDAKLTTAFARRGLVAEHGISWVLPRLVGPARALDLLLSARVVLGREAAAIGLVNAAMPRETVLDQALSYARDLAVNCSPASMATIKRQVYADLERTAPQALEQADRLMLASFQAPDFVEGVTSFLERREPRFAPLAVG
jgi:enoyl-CoA hydratase/carnithine racemase